MSALGYSYLLHRTELPGTPDLVLRKHNTVVFVHGCFWHRHAGCSLARLPKSRLDFWIPKLESNKTRDVEKLAELRSLGWRVLTVWECQIRSEKKLASRIVKFLDL